MVDQGCDDEAEAGDDDVTEVVGLGLKAVDEERRDQDVGDGEELDHDEGGKQRAARTTSR